MEEQELLAHIVSRLGTIDDHHGTVTGGIIGMIRRGWHVEDIVAWNRCLEEVNPELDEAIALRRMDEIERRVLRYLAGECTARSNRGCPNCPHTEEPATMPDFFGYPDKES
jgi:hypothetical protein